METNKNQEAFLQAFAKFKMKMSLIRKKQLSLFAKIDKTISEEKSQKIREKINLQ